MLVACQKEVSNLQSEYFVRFYGDALDDIAGDIGLTPEGGYVFAGTTTRSSPRTDKDIILITTDKFGFQNSETVYFGGLGNETCKGLLVLDDGYVLTGSVNTGGVDSLILVKFGTDGILKWSLVMDTDLSWDRTGQGNDIALINNQIVIAGYTLSGGPQKPMFCTFTLEGRKFDWDSPPSNPGGYYTSIFERDKQIFGFGTSLQNASNSDMFIIGKGNISDRYPFALSGNETSSKIIPAEGSGFFFVGTADPLGSGFSQIVIKKLKNDFSEDLSFNTNPLGSDADFRGVDIKEMEDGSLVILGDKSRSNDTDIVLHFLNPDGTTKSSKVFGRTGNQTAYAMELTPDGGIIVLGSNRQEKTNSMITLIKTDKEGNIWE